MFIKIWKYLVCLNMLIIILLLSVYTTATDRQFYENQYVKNTTNVQIGITIEDLNTVTDNLLNYLTGQRENLNMKANIQGVEREVFDEQEKLHMIDVKELFLSVINVFIILLVFDIISLIILYRNNPIKSYFKQYKNTLLISSIACLTLGVVFYFNFNWFWTNFHHVFFSNDLWILDPNISVMINMFPIEFFLSMCITILIKFAIMAIIVFILLYIKNHKIKTIKY